MVEELDARCCPSQIASLSVSVQYESARQVLLTGYALDANNEASTVYFSGALDAQVTTAGDGSFSYAADASALGAVSAYAVDADGHISNHVEVDLASLNPNVSASITYGSGQTVIISGNVADEDPASCTVALTGPVTGTVTPDANGNFTYQADAADLGSVSIVATDAWGLTGSTSVDVASNTPAVNFSISYGTCKWVTLSGTVTDNDPQSTTVVFSGPVSASVTPGPDGSFSVECQASSLATITATVTNVWGLTGTSTVDMSVDPPDITSFTGSEGPGFWTFTGAVAGPDVAETTYTLSGLPSLEGNSGTLNSDGSCNVSIALCPTECGSAELTVTDVWGQTDTVTYYVSQG
jgi:hypothetical protein